MSGIYCITILCHAKYGLKFFWEKTLPSFCVGCVRDSLQHYSKIAYFSIKSYTENQFSINYVCNEFYVIFLGCVIFTLAALFTCTDQVSFECFLVKFYENWSSNNFPF